MSAGQLTNEPEIRGRQRLTKNVEQCEELTEEVSVGPEVVVFKVGIQVVEDELLLLPFLRLGNDAEIQIHF